MKQPPRVIPIQPDPQAPPVVARSLFEAHQKVQVRSVQGWFTNLRWAMVWLTQIAFYGLPWLPWHGRQAVLFDLNTRRFFLFDLVLLPQDFIYLAALLVLCALGLFFFTALAGRLWCGYACPQTVYTEVFMWVEHHLEGDRTARLRLDKQPWGPVKLLRRGGKHLVWLLISLWTGLTFVGYFTPMRELLGELLTARIGPWEAFWSLFYGLATYGNAGFLRDQVCKYMCPYARFQGVMLDADSLIVGFDTARGEPRGARPKSVNPRDRGLGDCIDCTLCVQVCPVGIDIRDGFQMECIGCGACIDACDGIMDKMAYPRGLIRYATQNGMASSWTRTTMLQRVWRPRTLLYGAALMAGVAAFAWSLASRPPFRVDVIRDRGVMARLADDGGIDNVYRLFVMNSDEAPHRYQIDVSGTHGIYGLRVDEGQQLMLGPMDSRQMTVRIHLSPEAAANLTGQVIPIQIGVEQNGRPGETVRVMEKSTFIVPR
jgi:cytochrome c oxidase accessory protein FixG